MFAMQLFLYLFLSLLKYNSPVLLHVFWFINLLFFFLLHFLVEDQKIDCYLEFYAFFDRSDSNIISRPEITHSLARGITYFSFFLSSL